MNKIYNFFKNYNRIKILQSNKLNDVQEYKIHGAAPCKVVSVYDADTFRVILFHENKLVKINIRAIGIDTPEIAPSLPDKKKLSITDYDKAMFERDNQVKLAKMARNRFINLTTDQNIDIDNYNIKKKDIQNIIDNNKKIVYLKYGESTTTGRGKYGRVLGQIYLDKDYNISVNQILIKEKLAVEYFGGTKKKW